jgi:hypothetical protein
VPRHFIFGMTTCVHLCQQDFEHDFSVCRLLRIRHFEQWSKSRHKVEKGKMPT